MRREAADAEQRAAQLEAELRRLAAAQKEREDDLERKMDGLNRRAHSSHTHACNSSEGLPRNLNLMS